MLIRPVEGIDVISKFSVLFFNPSGNLICNHNKEKRKEILDGSVIKTNKPTDIKACVHSKEKLN